ncbi:hypothetical protein PSHT_02716 [Puccinia striiformis]|uniref:RING-type domain-containing protein n=1 Tax=Puccinia striiformis TaxID=27350 RepID=A0A2S4WHH3_9BASI|nr:hypothetical protein PSHT_02716 [Puccinia striiformis]
MPTPKVKIIYQPGTRSPLGRIRCFIGALLDKSKPEDCPICLNPMEPKLTPITPRCSWVGCGHKFHTHCITEAFRATGPKTRCPVCRKPLPGAEAEPPTTEEHRPIPQDSGRPPSAQPSGPWPPSSSGLDGAYPGESSLKPFDQALHGLRNRFPTDEVLRQSFHLLAQNDYWQTPSSMPHATDFPMEPGYYYQPPQSHQWQTLPGTASPQGHLPYQTAQAQWAMHDHAQAQWAMHDHAQAQWAMHDHAQAQWAMHQHAQAQNGQYHQAMGQPGCEVGQVCYYYPDERHHYQDWAGILLVILLIYMARLILK